MLCEFNDNSGIAEVHVDTSLTKCFNGIDRLSVVDRDDFAISVKVA